MMDLKFKSDQIILESNKYRHKTLCIPIIILLFCIRVIIMYTNDQPSLYCIEYECNYQIESIFSMYNAIITVMFKDTDVLWNILFQILKRCKSLNLVFVDYHNTTQLKIESNQHKYIISQCVNHNTSQLVSILFDSALGFNKNDKEVSNTIKKQN